jgi:cytochrome c biogenesis protein
MSTAEETIKPKRETVVAKTETNKASKPLLNSFLDGLSSVRFGIFLLILLVIFSMVGMLIVQQNVDGFDKFFSALTPAEKTVYGWLGFFDIYHVWYFNLLLLTLSLNIILASIDRFPTAWTYIVKPKNEATKAYLLRQKQNTQMELGDNALETVTASFQKQGFKPCVTEKENGRKLVFAQKNTWNRLGAYIVHVALLTLFMGHFVALQTGYDADVSLTPGTSTNEIQLIRFNMDKKEKAPVSLPFTIICTDISQKLLDAKGSIDINNTLDWATQIKIEDPVYGVREANVSMNQPYSYRGYRFFQASTIPVGSARNMTLRLTPENGGQPVTIDLARNGTAKLEDGTVIKYEGFFADFTLNGGKPDTRSADYNNPAAQLTITSPSGETKNAFAFAVDLPGSAPIGAPVFGYKYKLIDFEKAPMAHVLSIKYDPFYGSTIAWYWGGGLLMLALCLVFFFAHQRIWAVIEPDGKVTLGGHTNRNEFAFNDKFEKIKAELETAKV